MNTLAWHYFLILKSNQFPSGLNPHFLLCLLEENGKENMVKPEIERFHATFKQVDFSDSMNKLAHLISMQLISFHLDAAVQLGKVIAKMHLSKHVSYV